MRNVKQSLIAFLVSLPSLSFYLIFLRNFHTITTSTSDDSLSSLWIWCAHHPLLLANILFFLNVNILFWLISLIQSSHWIIDLYWTVIPVMLVHYYANHPFSRFNFWRSTIMVLLTWIWSIRLTHNYFRRENWEWCTREDWRFADMRKKYGKHWWWISFFAVYFVQQFFLIGVCLPMYAIHTTEKPWNAYDSIATVVCICGIIIAYFADTQLYEFVSKNGKLKDLGEPLVPNLEKGLWRYSRHPNYFGEMLWWWGLVIFGWNVGHGWTFIGSFINSLCLACATILVENRMLRQEYRVEAYRQYQKSTSVWIPWFKSSPTRGGKEKNF